MIPLIIIRGGGDLASGIALRLYHVGFQVAILELDKPRAVRRTVSFCEAVYDGAQSVEGVTARLVSGDQFQVVLEAGEIPILIDPDANALRNQFITSPRSTFVVDARLLKEEPELLAADIPLHIGLGPGFRAGENCHAVIETRRSHTLGRVLWSGETQPDSGVPEGDPRRVLRAPSAGNVQALKQIGDHCDEGENIAIVKDKPLVSPFEGVLRGIIHPSVEVTEGMKIGDVDSRNDPGVCSLVSDKALAVGGGVLEAVLITLKGME
ncbi:MAG: selenium-dependent molybdenum cofactor biosynthesis protein YqeB [Anaerolineales bacterium]|nr:MAG: selenium-dependent molybdenum cofactor biosynthesis protein YqeB [Anaerolineales bacterium]